MLHSIYHHGASSQLEQRAVRSHAQAVLSLPAGKLLDVTGEVVLQQVESPSNIASHRFLAEPGVALSPRCLSAARTPFPAFLVSVECTSGDALAMGHIRSALIYAVEYIFFGSCLDSAAVSRLKAAWAAARRAIGTR